MSLLVPETVDRREDRCPDILFGSATQRLGFEPTVGVAKVDGGGVPEYGFESYCGRGPYAVVVDEVDHTRESKDLIDSFCLL